MLGLAITEPACLPACLPGYASIHDPPVMLMGDIRHPPRARTCVSCLPPPAWSFSSFSFSFPFFIFTPVPGQVSWSLFSLILSSFCPSLPRSRFPLGVRNLDQRGFARLAAFHRVPALARDRPPGYTTLSLPLAVPKKRDKPIVNSRIGIAGCHQQ